MSLQFFQAVSYLFALFFIFFNNPYTINPQPNKLIYNPKLIWIKLLITFPPPSDFIIIATDDMITSLRRAMGTFPDIRTGKNIQYEIMDAASGALGGTRTPDPFV